MTRQSIASKLSNQSYKRVTVVSLVFLSLIIQWLFTQNYALSGLILFVSSFFVIGLIPQRWYKLSDPEPFHYADFLLVLIIWIGAVAIRIYHIDQLYDIGDLTSRYGYAIIHILKGEHIFPCIEQFECDESLTAYLMVPWAKFFGLSWTSFKLIAIGYSSLLIPASYFTIRQFGNRMSAAAGSGFIAMSVFFHGSDPIPGLLKFKLITIIYIGCIGLAYYSWKKQKSSILVLSLLTAIGNYIHSSARVIPVMLITIALLGLHKNRWEKSGYIFKQISLYLLATFILFIPMIIYLAGDTNYFFFKNRQIYGFHESYPFTLTGLMHNIWTILITFNYRAWLTTQFPNTAPLLMFIAASTFLGGIWLLVRNRGDYRVQILFCGVLFAFLPLCIVTPGNWRGLYLAPLVTMIFIISGLWIGTITNSLFNGNKILTYLSLLSFFLLIGWYQIPVLFRNNPKTYTRQTRLYADILKEPNIPHYFSCNLSQCSPNIATYEFAKGAFLDEYHVFLLNPLRYMIDYDYEAALNCETLNGKPAVFVFSPRDYQYIQHIQKQFPNSVIDALPTSKLKVLRIKPCN